MPSEFHLSDKSHLIRPPSTDLAVLIAAIRSGESVFVAPSSGFVPPAKPQYLFAQSSGSTGKPKIIRRTPLSWMTSFEITRSQFGITETDRYGVFGALQHSLALYATMEAFHLGADLACMEEMSPKAQAALICDQKLSVLYVTPTQLTLLLRTNPTLPSVTHVFCGGGRLPAPIVAQLPKALPNATFREFFGASETSFITMSDATTPLGSVGQAYPGVTLELKCTQEGNASEIWVKSPYLFEGYAQGSSTSTTSQNGFVAIGEMGCLDDFGNLYLLGRKDRMITVADQNVFPERIEALVEAQPSIQGCAVIALKDDLRGHRLVCLIEGQADVSQLRRLCRETLGEAHTPHQFHTQATLPRLAMGKPDLVRLQTQLEATS